jgi:hypothetical protein
MEEQELRERLDAVEVPPIRITVEDLVGSGRRRVWRRRALRATGATALATGIFLAMPSVLFGRDGHPTLPPAAVSRVDCPVRTLPMPPGLTGVSADAIDPSGRFVLGTAGAPVEGVAGMRPVLWTDGHPQVLPLAGKAARATSVNANGVVVALAAVGQTKNWDAILRYTGGQPVRLSPPAGDWVFLGDAKINAAGDILVDARPHDRPEGAGVVLFWAAGATTGVRLPLPARASGSDLTDDGTIIGDVTSADGQRLTPYAWDRAGNGRKLTLPAGQDAQPTVARGVWATGNMSPSGKVARWNLRTGGFNVIDVGGPANAINAGGWVVAGQGVYRDDATVTLAPVGTATGIPIAIADNGTVVGSLWTANTSAAALVWTCH